MSVRPIVRAAIALCLVASLPAHFAPAAQAGPEGFKWRSWDEGLREAAETDRPVLVDVYTDWCGWCRRMDRDVYARQDVRDYLTRNFVPVKLNAESRAHATYKGRKQTSRAIASRFGVRGYPTSVFLRPNGDHLVNVSGYVPHERFLLVLRYIGDGHLDRGTPWETFQKQAKGGGR